MKSEKIEQKKIKDASELNQEQETKLSPIEENKKARRRRMISSFLFVLFLSATSFISFTFFAMIFSEDLHYRVINEIENRVLGINVSTSGTYMGETDFGYYVGNAIFTFSTGAVYEGEWNDNFMHGIGTLNVPDEGVYEGEFVNSKKEGKGIFTWNDGTVYSGQWENDQMDGRGTYVTSDSVQYVGEFEGNRLKKGTCTFTNETGEYTAEFENFEINKLIAILSDGTKYEGEANFENLNGVGELQLINGDVYSGNFVDGNKHGEGTYSWISGDVYSGDWKNNEMDGSGTYTYADGSFAKGTFVGNQFTDGTLKVINDVGEYSFTIKAQEPIKIVMKLKTGTTYIGEMTGGELTGDAQITYSNGDLYSGPVVDGRKSGYGTYTFASGAKYEGDWLEDKMNGQGTYFFAESQNGYKVVGQFENNGPTGQCQYYVTSSENYKTDWKNGKCVKIYE